MELTAINIILAIIILIIIPYIMGGGILKLIKLQNANISLKYVAGHMTMWAVCQLVAVPFILLQLSLDILTITLMVIYASLTVYGIYTIYVQNKHKKIVGDKVAEIQLNNVREKRNKSAQNSKTQQSSKTIQNIQAQDNKLLIYIAYSIMTLAVILFVLASIFMQHTDEDDSRLIVNAVDAYRTNRLMLTDVNTGNRVFAFIGDMNKDVASPWAMYIAVLSKITGIYPTIMMHTIMPPVLMLLASAIFWLLSGEFFKGDDLHRCIFVCFVILLNIYGGYSVRTAEMFFVIRSWQGKATVAGIGVPAVLYLMLKLFDECRIGKEAKETDEVAADINNDKSRTFPWYMLILIFDTGICLLSNMGILLMGLMIGCFGLVYGILNRKISISIYLWLICLVNAVYIGIAYVIY